MSSQKQPVSCKGSVLLVEDDQDLLWMLADKLQEEGFRVLKTTAGEEGLKLARKHRPDMIMLDIALPSMDGLELIQILRQETSIPILFLTARNTELDRLLGFRLGAADYISKPFSLEEVAARAKAILRLAGSKPERPWKGPRIFGKLEVSLEKHEVRVNGRFAALAPKEFEILKLLIEADGVVLSREQFLKAVWNYDSNMDISTRSIDQHVAQIRRKLKSEGRRIVTVKNFGYKFSQE
jgi:DNA-binding response OmpR family regulator